MGFFTGILIAIAISGIGTGIVGGLRDLGDSIKIAHGYREVCEDKKWYEISHCTWEKVRE